MNIFHSILLINNSGGVLTPPTPPGESFYVSGTGSGTGVGSMADPFTGAQFLNLVDSGLPGIPTGSSVSFNRGEVFPYQYNIDDSSIIISAYGTGDDPIISGSDDISGQTWTNDGGNVYYTSLASEPKWVFLAGQEVKMSETDWITITNRPIQTQVAADQTTLQTLNGVETLVGAYILCKEWSFRPCLRRTVTAYNGTTTLTLDAAPNTDASGAGTGMPFKLLNKRSFITEVGEWSYDAVADRLYIMTAGGAPTDIRISTRDYGIKLSTGVSNISVSNIKFEHQFLEGFYSTVNHNITVTQCNFSDLRTNGASFTGDGTNITFTFNTLERISNNAVHIGAINGGVFSNNTFSDVGVQDGVSIPYYSYFKSVGCGIHTRWDSTGTIWVPQNLTINNNTFSNMGYCPIVYTGIGHTCNGNYIDLYGQRWADCGGIYVTNVYGTIYGNGSDTTDCLVQQNTILNGIPSARTLEGITGGSTVIMGVYIDNNCSSITVNNNYIENMNHSGIHVNWSNQNHIITNNKIAFAGDACIQFIKWEGSGGGTVLYPLSQGHTCTGNLMVIKNTTSNCLKVYSVDNDSYNPFANGGSSDNNTFVTPYRQDIIEIDFSSTTNNTLAAWQAIFSQDLTSTLIFTDHLWVDATKGAIDVVTGNNSTNSPTTLTPSADYYYVDEVGHDTDFEIPARSGKIVWRTHRPRLSVVVDDTYTGTAGALSGHTPDVGVAWTIESGTQAINGSGGLTASAQGNILQTAPGPDVEVETIFQVPSVTAGTIIRFRFIGNSDNVSVQLLLTAGNEQLNIFNNGSTILTMNPGNLAINTDITLRARIEGGTLSVWVNDVLKVEIMGDAALEASNPSTTEHGLNVPTTNVHTRTRIWAL